MSPQTSANKSFKVFCIDDEQEILKVFEDAVGKAGFTPRVFSEPAAALAALSAEVADVVLVLSDYRMPGMNGFELRRAMLADGAAVPFVIVSSFVTKEMALEALELRIAAFFDKPVAADGILEIVTKEAAARLEHLTECRALEAIFIEEAGTIVEEMEPVILALDHDRGNQELLNVIYRGAHTLKGSSGVLDTNVITKYVHRYEDVISSLRRGDTPLTDDLYELLLRGYDRIKELIASIGLKTTRSYKLTELLAEVTPASGAAGGAAPKLGGATPPAPANKQDPQKSKPKDSIPVPTSMLDEVSGYSGEITVIRNMVNKIVRSLERSYAGNKDIQRLGELLDEMHKINSAIQGRITDLRKVSIANVFKPIPRILRDLSRDLDKSIKFLLEGDTLRIDNSLAQVLSNSLVHLIRNSADHGLETTAERAKAGKSAQGVIAVSAVEDHEVFVVTIRDDGRGINPAKIKEKALEKGLYSAAQLAAMSEAQILAIVFASGFSTAAKVTDVSGRGVGMDMVRSSVEAVGGSIDIESKVGKGSAFTLRLPVPKSVQIINSLLVEAGGRCFAVPQDAIVRILRIEPARAATMVQRAASGLVLRTDDAIYPLIDLCRVLALGAADSPASGAVPATLDVIIVRVDAVSYALAVEGIQDAEEIVVKKLQACFNPQEAYAGATFMGDGSIGLILDMKALAGLAGIGPSAANLAKATAEASAVADDQKSILLFHLDSKTVYGVPIEQVFRLEELDATAFQRSGAERVSIYRDRIMPILSLRELLQLKSAGAVQADPPGRTPTIVVKSKDGYVGLEISSVVDIATVSGEVSTEIRDRVGIVGNTFVRDASVTVVDLPIVLRHAGRIGGFQAA